MALNTNDPLYAYNSYGYTNQNDGGTLNTLTANIPTVASLGSTSLLGPNEAIIQGVIAETLDPQAFTHSAQTMTSGTTYGAKILLAAPAVVTNVLVFSTAAGTSSLFFGGLYSASGTLVATSADVHASLGSNAQVTAALTAPVVVSAGLYYVAILSVTGTTTTVNGISSAANGTGFPGFGLSVPSSGKPFSNTSPRWASLATGATTALPTSVTPSSASFSAVGFWAALS